MTKVVGWVGAFIALAALSAVILTVLVYFLWNWLMPTIFGLKTITLWQAAGLLWLTSLLFKRSVGEVKERKG